MTITAPKCKTCGVPHRGTCLDHQAQGAIASQIPRSSNGRTTPFDGVNAGSNPDRGTKLLELQARVVETAARVAAKPKRGKRVNEPKKPGRGRPKKIDDMKAYKAQKARERRAAQKAKPDSP